MSGHIKVRAVIYEGRGVWVAQCLEYDIAAFSKTLSDLPRAFRRAVAANVIANTALGRVGLEGVPPAPERFTALYDAARIDLSARDEAVSRPVAVDAELRFAEAA